MSRLFTHENANGHKLLRRSAILILPGYLARRMYKDY